MSASAPMTTAASREASPEPTTRDVAAKGARIRFVEAGAGPALVLIHDFLSSHLAFEEVLAPLARSFHVIAPDLPGFGESEKPPPSRYDYGYTAFSEAIVDLVAALGLSRVALVGHALGASVALTTAAQHPHVVERLILVSPEVDAAGADPLARAAALPVIGALFFKQLYGRRLFRAHFRKRIGAAAWGAAAARVDALFDLFNGPAAREAAFATMLAVQDRRGLTASVPRVTSPSLVISGRHDPTSRAELGRRLAREIRGARFDALECGHSPHEECPDRFVAVVTAFLRGGKGA